MLTVAQVIRILQGMPQHIPVTGYNAHEETDFVSNRGIQLRQTDEYETLQLPDGSEYHGQFVDIMGF